MESGDPGSVACWGELPRRYPNPSEYVRALVSGRNRIRREQSLIAMLSQAFIDESGGVDRTQFVLGGYVGSVDAWTSFSDSWQAVLDARSLPPLHMTALRNKKDGGAWYALGESEQHEVLLELVGVVAEHDLRSFIGIVGINDFKARMPTPDSQLHWTSPYSFAACLVVGGMVSLEEVCGREFGQIEVVFDWMQQFYRDVGWVIEQRVRTSLGDLAPRLGRVCWAGKDNRDRYVPLQAADMLVWHQRRKNDPSIPARNKAQSNEVFERLKNASKPKYCGGAPGKDLLAQWISGWDDAREREVPPSHYSPVC